MCIAGAVNSGKTGTGIVINRKECPKTFLASPAILLTKAVGGIIPVWKQIKGQVRRSKYFIWNQQQKKKTDKTRRTDRIQNQTTTNLISREDVYKRQPKD